MAVALQHGVFWQALWQASYGFKSEARVGILEFFLVPLSAILLKFMCWNSTSRRRETDVKQTNLHPYPTTYFQPHLVVPLRWSLSLPSLWIVEQCSKLAEIGWSQRQGLLFVSRQGGSSQKAANRWWHPSWSTMLLRVPQGIGSSQKAANRWWHPSWSTMLLRVPQGIGSSQKAAHRWWHPSWSTMLLRVPSHWKFQATGSTKPPQAHQDCQTRELQSVQTREHHSTQTREHTLTREPFWSPQLALLFSHILVDCYTDGQVIARYSLWAGYCPLFVICRCCRMFVVSKWWSQDIVLWIYSIGHKGVQQYLVVLVICAKFRVMAGRLARTRLL
jgi:hypothetical protein